MSSHDDVDRSVARWLESEARPAATADVLDRALRATRQRRPRPRLSARFGSHWVGDGAASPGRVVWRTGVRTSTALVVLLLVVVALAGAVAVGARLLFQTPSPPGLRSGGEVIVFERLGTGPGWDLAAQDPETGEVRKIVETDGIVDCPDSRRCANFVRRAEWSSDGRWVAFQVSNASLDGPPLGPCAPTVGLWVASALGDPRQLTAPCEATSGAGSVEELWSWSSDGARLAVARVDGTSDDLFVVDPSDGVRTLVAMSIGDPTALEWSPDGTRIAIADGTTVYDVGADGGGRALLADSFVDIIDIDWSPEGSRILVHDQGRSRIQVMNTDGSDRHVVLEGQDACCSTEWSPAGDRVLYMLSVIRPGEPEVGSFDSQVWTVSPDGSNAIEVFDSDGCELLDPVDPPSSVGFVGDSLPVWVPGGTQVAYNDCGEWVVANADGTGEPQALGGARSASDGPPLLHRSWDGGGLSGWDLASIGQVDH